MPKNGSVAETLSEKKALAVGGLTTARASMAFATRGIHLTRTADVAASADSGVRTSCKRGLVAGFPPRTGLRSRAPLDRRARPPVPLLGARR